MNPTAAEFLRLPDHAHARPEEPIPLARPSLSALERQYVEDVLRSDRLALGPWLERFEQQMADVCSTAQAVAVSSGTAALHLIVRALGLGPGDEVLTTPFSFVASSNALLFEGVRPLFVDIDPTTYNLDVECLEAALTPATRAVLAVDVFGYPADWPALTRFAKKHDLLLIDDACEALGSEVNGRPVGSWGGAAAFGFYPNKQITTGEGGCLTTNDEDLAGRCRSLRNQGRADRTRMKHVRLGYNYRLSELQAALGCAQLERLPELIERRATVAARYREVLNDLTDDLALPAEPSVGSSTVPTQAGVRSWFVYVVRLHERFPSEARDRLMTYLQERGVGCAPYFPAIHLQPYYRERFGFQPGAFPVTESVAARTLALPFFPDLTEDQVTRVAAALADGLAYLRSSCD